jgi:hypothetical protein
VPSERPARGWFSRLFAVGCLALLGLGCETRTGGPPPLVLLVTVDALRADALLPAPGGRTAMPQLARLAARGAYAGPAIASSSWTVPALASLWTGLGPWQHGALHPLRANLAPTLHTLPEALARAGYETVALRSNNWLTAAYGWDQGFHRVAKLGDGRPAIELLRQPVSRPRFVWVHIAEALPPYEVGERGEERVRETDLDRWSSGREPIPAAERDRIRRAYLADVGRVDAQIGRLVAAIPAALASQAVVAVVGVAGVELGDHGRVGAALSLDRAAIEVPLVLALPGGGSWRLDPQLAPPGGGPGAPLATARLWATLLEVVGAPIPPAAAPSLLAAGSPPTARSELYLGNGHNLFSLRVGDRQLVRTVPFGTAQPDFFASADFGLARTTSRAPDGRALAALHPRLLRLLRAFDHNAPFSGAGAPELALRAWLADGQTPGLAGEQEALALDEQLARELRTFVGTERSPAAEGRARRRDARLGAAPSEPAR